MKINFNYILIAFCLFSLISCILIFDNCNAQANRAELSFLGEPTYRLVSKLDKNIEGWRYQINVTIQNTGNIISDKTRVNLKSDAESFNYTDKNKNEYVEIDPGSSIDVTFNWSTTSSEDQDFIISFCPTGVDPNKNQYNSDSTSFTLIVGDVDKTPSEDTPGFELFVLIVSLFVILFSMRKRRK